MPEIIYLNHSFDLINFRFSYLKICDCQFNVTKTESLLQKLLFLDVLNCPYVHFCLDKITKTLLKLFFGIFQYVLFIKFKLVSMFSFLDSVCLVFKVCYLTICPVSSIPHVRFETEEIVVVVG